MHRLSIALVGFLLGFMGIPGFCLVPAHRVGLEYLYNNEIGTLYLFGLIGAALFTWIEHDSRKAVGRKK